MSLEFLKDLEAKHNLKVIDCFKSGDYGPLEFIDSKVSKNFADSFYVTVRPRTVALMFKLNLKPLNRNYYCLIESESIKHAYLEENLIINYALKVPSDLKFFCGRLNRKRVNRIKHSVMLVFVPDEYLRILIESQNGRDCNRELLNDAILKQCKFFQNYINATNLFNEKFLENHLSMERAIKYTRSGNNLHNMPNILRKALRTLNNSSHRCIKLADKLPTEIYELHSEIVRLPDGRFMKFKLVVTACFETESVEPVTKSKKPMSDVSWQKYKIIFSWI